MDTAEDIAARRALQDAYKALREGDKRLARRAAERAVFLARDTEEPWLVLAETSSPRASIAYIQQALKINPDSPTAVQALQRAQVRLRDLPEREGQRSRGSSATVVKAARPPATQQNSLLKTFFSCLVLACILTIVGITVMVWYAWSHNLSGASQTVSLVPIHRSTLTFTPVFSPTISRTATLPSTHTPVPTLTATATNTQTPTSSPAPTFTQTPTALPAPTRVEHSQNIYTVKRGETLESIAAKFGCDLEELMSRNNIDDASSVKKGTRLVIPMGTSAGSAQNKGGSPPSPVQKARKSILVDISEQHVYAYEGKKLVLSFDASTGRNGSTIAGTYSILDKIPDAWSAPWGFWMPNWMGIYYVGSNLENGFHALPVLTNGTEIWGDEIGVPITYGCVVLDSKNMKKLYHWAEIGTPVVIRH